MTQFAVMEALLNKGDMTVGELTDTVLSTSGNMTVVIKNLVRQGWVQRYVNHNDNRSYLINLTDSGKTLISSVFKQHMSLVDEVLHIISDEEKQIVINILKRLK